MAGRLLDFKNYIGGADNVQVIEMFPSTQKLFTYDYGVDVSSYTFEADYQTVVVDTLTYDRVTGKPNFADSTVVGYFANAEVSNSFINTSSASTGEIVLTIPAQRYTGPITPDARNNIAITVLAFKWTDNTFTPATTDSHRWAIIERYEPDVSPGNPRLDANFVPLGVGAIATFTTDASTDASRVQGTYTISGLAGGDSEGTGATFEVAVSNVGVTSVNITNRGTNYIAADTIKLLDTDMGSGGAADITVTVSSTA